MPVFRLFCGMVAALNLKTRLYDVGNAFLECDLEEELYMQLPPREEMNIRPIRDIAKPRVLILCYL